jgi:spore coat polysaccharide biosynthesis protein SpsF (cytidylyltransferase family)
MSDTRVVAVVQARMGSTRLPGKVLKRVEDRPLLGILLSRIDRATAIDETVVATSRSSDDDDVATFASDRGVPTFRGSENDVLDRFLGAGRSHEADVVVRICADNPLTPAPLVDDLIGRHLSTGADYTAAMDHPTPVEVVDLAALEATVEHRPTADEREHVTLHVRNRPDTFDVRYIDLPPAKDVRLTVDYPEDLHLLRRIAADLGDPVSLALDDVIDHVKSNAEIRAVNADVESLPDAFDARPAVSVVVRTYNDADVAGRAIESALDQTLDDARYEVVVVDDGSTDGTVDLVSMYAEANPTLVRAFPTAHSGPISTLNDGIDRALGKYVVVLDADDHFDAPLLERMYDILERRLDVDFVYSDYHETPVEGEREYVDTGESLFATITIGIMFRKEALLAVGLYDEGLAFPEYDLLAKLLQAGAEGYHIADPLFTYDRQDDSLTADRRRVERGRRELRERYGESFDFREY